MTQSPEQKKKLYQNCNCWIQELNLCHLDFRQILILAMEDLEASELKFSPNFTNLCLRMSVCPSPVTAPRNLWCIGAIKHHDLRRNCKMNEFCGVQILLFHLALLWLLLQSSWSCSPAGRAGLTVVHLALKFPIRLCPTQTAEMCIQPSPDNLSFHKKQALTGGGGVI